MLNRGATPSTRDRFSIVKGFSVHACFLDSECRDYGAPNRLHLFTPWGTLMLGVAHDDWAQAWFPLVGYTDLWLPVTWHPDRRRA